MMSPRFGFKDITPALIPVVFDGLCRDFKAAHLVHCVNEVDGPQGRRAS